MRTILSLCVIISAAVACPTVTKSDCCCDLPKICPSSWHIKKFETQCATLAFQGKWYIQWATPTYIDGQDPLKTGLFCNTYPCTQNELIFRDTTPCDNTDFNTEYEVTDSSYNLYTQCIETQKATLSPAYGKSSKYALFNVGSERYYKNPLQEKYPFIDDKLIRHKISGICEREYTIAVIGADDCWKEYMVVVVMNEYENFFCGNKYLIWVMTRDVQPKWSTYYKAFEDIKRSDLCPYYLVSVDHSLNSLKGSGIGPISPIGSIATGDISDVVQQTSVSTKSATKSVVSGCSSSTSSSTTTSTVQTSTSTVIIKKSSDFKSLYQYGQCDLYKSYDGVKIIKNFSKDMIRNALSGIYYMSHATPCSFYDYPDSKVGILNTAAPACSMQLLFDDISMDTWDYNTPHMMMDRGYNMLTGDLHQTRSYITSVYSKDHPYCNSVYSIYSEGYYKKPIIEKDCLKLDGMICKRPSDIYKHQIIASIIGYKENKYIIFCIANNYENRFFKKKQVPLIYCYTRERVPCKDTMYSITQEILNCGINPNHIIKIDQTKNIDKDFTFDKSYYESTVTSFTSSTTRSIVSKSGKTVVTESTTCELPSICPKNWHVKTFDSQYATIAFQGIWNLQMATPTYIKGNNPLKTGLFCNTYPCTQNQLIFRDTTPCDNTDFNTDYEVTDSSYNLYSQCIETQKAKLWPAYGKSSKYALFNVGSERYYKTAIHEKYPFIDKGLIKHKISGIYEREYTIAVIGADDCWKEYMVIVVMNEYDNYFCGNKNIIWVMTRDVQPKWSTYQKAFKAIKKSGLCPNYLVSVDHSLNSLKGPSIGPISPVASIATGEISDVVKKTSVSTKSATKSVVSGCSSSTSSSTTTSTVQTSTSTVVIEKCTDYKSLYEYGTCDLYKGIQIIKCLDKNQIRNALSGIYYMSQATPCSFYDYPDSKVGILNTAAPACSMQLLFDDISMDTWDYNTPHMMMDRGYNMMTGEMQQTRSYISSVYSEDHPYSSSIFCIYSEGYYKKPIIEKDCLKLDGMICKRPSDIYNQQIILSIIGYKENDYVIFCGANMYENPFFSKEQVHQIYVYTRARVPCQETMRCITQDLLLSGCNPNHLMRIDQTQDITEKYVFDATYYESQTSCWSTSSSSYSSSSSSSSSRSSSTTTSSSGASISVSCD